MSDKPQAPDHDSHVDLALVDYMLRLDAGERIDRKRFLEAYPDLRADLEAYLQAEDELAQAVEDIRPTLMESLGLEPSQPSSGHEAATRVATPPTVGAGLTVSGLPPTQPAAAGPAGLLKLDGFQILGQIGRGGMGIVYRAIQVRLHREVALKVLPPALADDPDRLKRFRNEAALAAAVNESHILPVYDIVESDGVPVLVMPYVDGCDLGRLIHDRRAHAAGEGKANAHPWAALSDQDYLERILPVLDMLVNALASLHAADILHRDIKPSNVLIDRRGGVWLTDFGLARLGAHSGLTRPGAAVGTAGFMSPEQARGASDLDGRTDVFGAGVTIYQALTLESPYGKEVIHERQALPQPPSCRQRLVSRDFDGVVLKALEPDRDDRYASAADFESDWRRVRQGLMPLARAAGRMARFSRWIRRNPWPVATGILALALMAGLIALLPSRHANVYLPTQPPGATGVMVPLGPHDGAPQGELAIRSRTWADRGIMFRNVPPGDYLVEVGTATGQFHEVLRHVPADDELPLGPYAHQTWTRRDRSSILLVEVRVPAANPTQEMQLVKGGTFIAGGDEQLPLIAPAFECRIPDFYLDRTEVSMQRFRIQKVVPVPSLIGEEHGRQAKDAVGYITWDEAVAYAECIGKRLPGELEYEYAATGGGKHPFPWGRRVPDADKWTFGEVGSPADDRCLEHPLLAGLFSNVAEWTSSWNMPYPSAPAVARDLMPPDYESARVVRGGPYSVATQNPDPADIMYGPRYRHSIDRTQRYAGLGFRCARSASPRWLLKKAGGG